MTIETTTSHSTTAFSSQEFKEKLLNGFTFTGPMTVTGDLDLHDLVIKSLPMNVHVKGTFTVPKELKMLPKGLIVEGALVLSESSVEELPQDLEVRGNLLASRIALTSLPAVTVRLYGDIDFQGSKLAQVPEWMTKLGPVMSTEESLVRVGNKSKLSGPEPLRKRIIDLRDTDLSRETIKRLKALIEANFIIGIDFKLSEPQKASKVALKNLQKK